MTRESGAETTWHHITVTGGRGEGIDYCIKSQHIVVYSTSCSTSLRSISGTPIVVLK